MDAPEYKQPQLDPALVALQAQSKEQGTQALQERLRGDSVSILARYGSRLAGGAGGGGLGPAPDATPAATPGGFGLAALLAGHPELMAQLQKRFGGG